MKLLTKTFVLAAIATVSLGSAAKAISIGDIVLDGVGTPWRYVGDYDVADGPSWFSFPPPNNYSAIQAAGLVFGVLPIGESYAISTSITMVDHKAWYDGFGDASHLPLSIGGGGGLSLPENFFADPGFTGYERPGDYSAYVADHAQLGGGATNHVFATAPVPDGGSTIALLGFAMTAVAGVRRKFGV